MDLVQFLEDIEYIDRLLLGRHYSLDMAHKHHLERILQDYKWYMT